MTETGRQIAHGQTIEDEDGEASCVEEHDSSFAKPLEAQTPMGPNGSATNSRSTGSKVECRKKWHNRTIKREKLKERILELRSLLKILIFIVT